MPRKFLLIIFAVLSFFAASGAVDAAESFNINPAYDYAGRSEITATERVVGNLARFYIEDAYWNSLPPLRKNELLSDVQKLSASYDQEIYNQLTRILGLEWKPGIDKDIKVTILLTRMQEEAGGYFEAGNELPLSQNPQSNEREMFYLNVLHAGERRAKAFMAHELQHLINYNQKTRTYGPQEEVWLNEMLSEMAPTFLGFDTPYEESNLQRRAEAFLQRSTDALLDWQNALKDYGTANLFGQYLRERYGKELFTDIIQSPLTGVAAIDQALAEAGSAKTAEDLFADWIAAVLVQDCSVLPKDTYCHLTPSLSADNLKITFPASQTKGAKEVAFDETTQDWAGNWFSFAPDAQEEERSKDHVFFFEISAPSQSDFTMPVAISSYKGTTFVKQVDFVGGRAEFALTDFGNLVSKVVVMPVNQYRSEATAGAAPFTRFSIAAELKDTIAGANLIWQANATIVDVSHIQDGALIRAKGSDDVYIVKKIGAKKFRRLILNPEIFNSYGHLRWEDIIEVSQEELAAFEESRLVMEVYPDGSPVTSKVYELSSAPGADTGIKRWLDLTSLQFEQQGYDWDAIYKINHLEAAPDFYAEGAQVTF